MATPVTNPFSTRHTRPGSIVPLDAAGAPMSVGRLVERLHRAGGSAVIAGPHGSGKSTLLWRLADAIEAGGSRVVRLRLRSWRDAGRVVSAVRLAGRLGTVCIDSWECLPGPLRTPLALVAMGTKRRLVVTAHGGCGLPVLVRCRTSRSLLEAIVGRLPGAEHWYGTVIEATDVEAAFCRRRGDIREALYELYDVFEARTRGFVPQRS